MFKRIKDITKEISGMELSNSNKDVWFPCDMDEGSTYRTNRNGLVAFIIEKAKAIGLLGSASERNMGNDAGSVPSFRDNNSSTGIMRHIGMGRIAIESVKTAFNRAFTPSGGNNGTSIDVARGNHTHDKLFLISDSDNSHSGTFRFTGVDSLRIDEFQLFDLMPYKPELVINPAITYTAYIYKDDGNEGKLVPISKDSLGGVVYTKVVETTSAGRRLAFDYLHFDKLDPSLNHVVIMHWIDDGGIFVANSGGIS